MGVFATNRGLLPETLDFGFFLNNYILTLVKYSPAGWIDKVEKVEKVVGKM